MQEVRGGQSLPFCDGLKMIKDPYEGVEKAISCDKCRRSEEEQVIIGMDELQMKDSDVRTCSGGDHSNTEENTGRCLIAIIRSVASC